MSNPLAPFAACVVAAGAVVGTPAIPVNKSFGGALTSHSGVGLYEFTLDDACNAAECLVMATPIGVVADTLCTVEHVSDTVKRVHTLAGALGPAVDTVGFNLTVSRMPAGH